MRRALWLALITASCLPALWPLATLQFFSSDDGLFHLYRLAALDDALRHGELYPRLFPSFAFGYGQPVLGYYGPLSYELAELTHLLGAPFPDALRWTFALGLIASGCTLFMLAREFVPPGAALLAAIAYVYFPYHLVDTYQRGALAEQLAFVWLPLVLWGLTPAHFAPPLRSGVRGRTRRVRGGGGGDGVGAHYRLLVFILALAALILTHLLTAMIFLPFVVVYALFMRGPAANAGRSSSLFRPSGALLALLLAAGLTAFYWLPVLLQSRWVGLSAGDNEGYRAHLASWLSFVQPSLVFQYPPAQLVGADQPLGLLGFVLLAASLLGALYGWRARERWSVPLSLFSVLAVAALLMMLDVSLPVWQALQPVLAFLQYPWRFMTLAALALAMCAALLFAQHTRLALLAALLLLVSATLALSPQPRAAPDAGAVAMWRNDYEQKQIGATWTAEYMPWWVRADRTAIPNASRVPASDVSQPAPQLSLWNVSASPSALADGYTRRAYQLAGPDQPGCAPLTLRFHQFYLPQWRVKLGSRALSPFPSTDLGLLSVELPCGATGEQLSVEFGLTDAEQIAAIVSLLTVAVVLWLWRGRWLVGALLALALVSALAFVRTEHSTPLAASIDAQVSGVADLIAVRYARDRFQAGDELRVALIWLARRENSENFKVFVHLMDGQAVQVLAQSDSDPVGGFTPTSQWHDRELIEDVHVLRIPDGASGDLKVFAGMYRYPAIQNLPVAHDGLAYPDDRIPLGVIHVEAR